MFKAQLDEGRDQWYVANDSRILMPAADAEDACRIAAELNRIIAAPRRMLLSTWVLGLCLLVSWVLTMRAGQHTTEPLLIPTYVIALTLLEAFGRRRES